MPCKQQSRTIYVISEIIYIKIKMNHLNMIDIKNLFVLLDTGRDVPKNRVKVQ